MRHPAQDIRHTTSVPKQFVKSDYIEATLSFSGSTSFGCFRSTSSLHSSAQLPTAGPHPLRDFSQCPRRQTRQVRSTRSNLASHILATSSIASKSWKMRGVIAESGRCDPPGES